LLNIIAAGGCSGVENCGFAVGQWKVKEANAKLVIIGCHTIKVEEIKAAAQTAGIKG